jgi:hypothetical protein
MNGITYTISINIEIEKLFESNFKLFYSKSIPIAGAKENFQVLLNQILKNTSSFEKLFIFVGYEK